MQPEIQLSSPRWRQTVLHCRSWHCEVFPAPRTWGYRTRHTGAPCSMSPGRSLQVLGIYCRRHDHTPKINRILGKLGFMRVLKVSSQISMRSPIAFMVYFVKGVLLFAKIYFRRKFSSLIWDDTYAHALRPVLTECG